MSADERRFLLWQYVGGDLHGERRKDLHQHILKCKECASYIWKLTKDSVSQPSSLEDPMPRPAIPLPSMDEPVNLDDRITTDPEPGPAAYGWQAATEEREAQAALPLEPQIETVALGSHGDKLSQSTRRKALIAIALAVTTIVCFGAIPALRGKPESSALRAQLKKLEQKSEELRRE